MDLKRYLGERNVPFQTMMHPSAFSAQRIAQTLHVPGREMAKTVLLLAEGTPVLAVLPATHRVDLQKAAEALGASSVEIAPEAEISRLFPDCEPGAIPPFGSEYGLRTLVDQSLLRDREIVFEGNTLEEAIRMDLQRLLDLEHPQVARFAQQW